MTAAVSVEAGSPLRERRCIVTRETLPEARLIRFVVGPENEVVPDLAAKLPGRGMWATADRGILERAAEKSLFSKAAKQPVRVPAGLSDLVEALLVKRMQEHLGLARRSGALLLGFDGVTRGLAGRRKPGVLIEAADGAADGRRKIQGAAQAANLDVRVLDILSAEELSMALGRENVVHAALFPGPLADRLVLDAERLEGFRPRETRRTGLNPVPCERQV